MLREVQRSGNMAGDRCSKNELARRRGATRALWGACAASILAACNNSPNPAPYHEKRADGSPWIARYAVLTEDPRSFDPQHFYDAVSRRAVEPVYECLLEYHPLKDDPYEVVPCLLAEMPVRERLPDGKESYLCKLKPGNHYHDDPCFPGGKGREIVAADMHYVFQRISDPKVESPFFAPLAEFVVGMTEAHRAAQETRGALDYARHPVTGIELLDRYTFRIHLTRAFPQLIYYLAMHCTSPVAREAVDYYDGHEHDGKRRPLFKFHMVGTGPFRFREYVPKQRVRHERFDGYRATVFPSDGFPPERAEWLQTLAGRPLPFIDEIHFAILRETVPTFVLGRQGYLDGIAVNKDAFAAMMTMTHELTPRFRARGMTLEKDVFPSTFWVNFNLTDPVVGQNKKLRQALSCAYDVQTYTDIFYSGVAPVAQQMIPPGLFGYDRNFRNPYGFNLGRARQLIAEAGYPNGRDARTGEQLVLTLDEPASGGEDRQRAEFEQRAFEALGIKVRIIENTFARLHEKADHGTFQMSSGSGWMADYPDPENYFFLFYSKHFPPTGKNYTRYNNPEFDRLFERMATMDNSPERLAIVRQMQEILIEDCPIILLFNKAYYSALPPWAPRTHHNMMLEGGNKYLVVDPALRAQKQREWNRQPVWPAFVTLGLFCGGLVYAVRWNRRQNA